MRLPGKLYQESEAFKALQNGEEKGLDFFFNLYYAPLVFFSRSLTNSYTVSQEIASEAFIRLWQRKETIAECTKVRFLLYRIVRNASIDYLRQQKSRLQRSEVYSQSIDVTEHTVLEKLVKTETYHHLYRMLSGLPPRCRQIFQMFYFQDKAIKEIAQELGISVNTVKTQKQRAVQYLREQQSSLSLLLIIFFFMAIF